MLSTRTMYLMTALVLGFAAIEPSSADSQARHSNALERTLPSLVSAQDYWSASKISFQLASERSRNNDSAAACEALAKETDTPIKEFGSGLGDDEGMREIRARFGCSGARA